MLPQSHFMVVAPLAAGREADLRALLASMNTQPGTANPHNPLLPFGLFTQLHFARFVLLDDALQADLTTLGLPRPRLPTYLAFMGDCDGSARACLDLMAQSAGQGLSRIFAHCEGFAQGKDLTAWMLAHDRPLAATYINWRGRSVQQIREEAALQQTLSDQVPRSVEADARRTHQYLRHFVETEVAAGRLSLSPSAPTPLGWQIRNLVHLLGVPLAGLVLLPFVILLLPWLIYALRRRETTDPVLCPRPDPKALQELQDMEDFDVSNQYTALGPVKPGRFRRGLVTVLLVLIDYACRHVFIRGHLARVQTIHFARWAFLDDKSRVVFTSNYDGSHQGYMDDFINKVAWGLNLVFGNGIGWPRTDWLILGGARHEQPFKYYQRRHQIPTQVWYKAYPGLTLADLQRNQRIRAGLENPAPTDAELQDWLRLL
ncbi:hypothetical protein [Rhodoferax sp.]|uniref:hypothetical protein n=1 Tax=Rhodoferax sp. TaxID=50421 RepID=UPI0025E66E91|nr:hypothetical protein [Rhodoferax sp.]